MRKISASSAIPSKSETGFSLNIIGSPGSGATADSEYDPTGAIHEAVLAAKEKPRSKLKKSRKSRGRVQTKPALTVEQILTWADAHHSRTGKWPIVNSGATEETMVYTWVAVNEALWVGRHGLPGGSSLARLLAEERGAYNIRGRPHLTVDLILDWARRHYEITGRWPSSRSGPVAGQQYETWSGVDAALFTGCRGLTGGMSLARLLYNTQGAPHYLKKEHITETQILDWADKWRASSGVWPRIADGPVFDGSDITWHVVNLALLGKVRGLPGGLTLPQFLAKNRGSYSRTTGPGLKVEQILVWADSHFAAQGEWPNCASGEVREAPGEFWIRVDKALREGGRGITPGSSLRKLLTEKRGLLPTDFRRQFVGEDGDVHYHRSPRKKRLVKPALNVDQIISWANLHYAATGKWPNSASGIVREAPHETWKNIARDLVYGLRGLMGIGDLPSLLRQHFGSNIWLGPPKLRTEDILCWADQHCADHGRWPSSLSGPIVGAPGEKWLGVDSALRHGYRGLTGGSSLALLLLQHRGVQPGSVKVTQ